MNYIPQFLYVMVGDGGGSTRYFKIGVARNLLNRVREVQTGCPVPITQVLSADMLTRRLALRAEKEMHAGLAGYRSSGEWFVFDMANATHKADFNRVSRAVLDQFGGADLRWFIESVNSMRERRANVIAEAVREQSINVRLHAYRMVNVESVK